MSKKLFAQDSFHQSGIGMFHQGQEIDTEKFSAGDIKALTERGLIGETDVAAERKEKARHANKAGKPAETK
jgi:hypothetical protein